MWKYAVRADNVGYQLLGHALDLAGFFVDETQPDRQHLTFDLVGWQPIQGTPSISGSVYLEVLAADGAVIGEYFLHSAEVEQRPDLRVTCGVDNPSNVYAADIWDKLRAGRPSARDEWAALPAAGRAAWLDVARMSAFSSKAVDVAGGHFEIDGALIKDTTGFYCAIGEAVNGPAGYFGCNLDALWDCLRGGFGVIPPFHLTWHSSELSRTRLGPAAMGEDEDGRMWTRQIASDEPQEHDGTQFEAILQMFAERGVFVDLR